MRRLWGILMRLSGLLVRLSRWGWAWVCWLAAFVVIEVWASLSGHAKPRTLSEHLWRWFPKRWRRVLLVGLLGLLALHLWSGPDMGPVMAPWGSEP